MYVDTLNNLKKDLHEAGLTREVRMTRKKMGGNIYLQLKKQTTKTSQVKSIDEDVVKAETHVKTSNVAVEIRGLDADVTTEELVLEISARITYRITSERVKSIIPTMVER